MDPDAGGPHSRVRVQGLSVRRVRGLALNDVSLDLETGIVAVAGPNGSGKSTLLRTLATLLPPSAGRVEVAGFDLATRQGRAQARSRLGFLSQEPAHLADFRVREAVAYAAWLHGLPRRSRPQRIARVLETLDLLDVGDARLGHLSGGERQRAYIAQVFVHDPPVLLLDEPTVGIDAEHRVELRRMIARLAADRLVVMSTHLTEDIEFLASEVVVLRKGAVAFQGSAADLKARGQQEHAADERPIERALRSLGVAE